MVLHRDCGGFTLLELLVTVALISMICGMGMMRLGNSLAEQELSAAALELAADLRWLQQVSTNSPVSAGGPSFYMVFAGSGKSDYLVRSGLQVVRRMNLPASVQFDNSPPILTFSATGSPAPGGVSIMLRSRRLNRVRYVIVAAVSGRVRVSATPAWEAGE